MSGFLHKGSDIELGNGRNRAIVHGHPACYFGDRRLGDAMVSFGVDSIGVSATMHMTPEAARAIADQLVQAAFACEQASAANAGKVAA